MTFFDNWMGSIITSVKVQLNACQAPQAARQALISNKSNGARIIQAVPISSSPIGKAYNG